LGIDVTTTTDGGLLGSGDAEQMAYALFQRRVVFSEDDDFLAFG
jgi:predicted nuclease of predicted toxin-antitoxin system